MKIIWSKTALLQLKDIYYIYSIDNTKKTAKLLSRNIVNRTNILRKFPEIGPKQDFDFETDIVYRYLVEGNYKIIYHLFENHIKIPVVFDTRQEPEKLVKLLNDDF
jgi:plasmid stabilization system protein ParE